MKIGKSIPLQNRHDEFIKLEKSITEVRDMFFEVAQLVQEQGEMVRSSSRLILAMRLTS